VIRVQRGRRQLRRPLPVLKPAAPVVRGQRPILRPELFTRLCQRMTALMENKITW
jgi:hypothetical protein